MPFDNMMQIMDHGISLFTTDELYEIMDPILIAMIIYTFECHKKRIEIQVLIIYIKLKSR